MRGFKLSQKNLGTLELDVNCVGPFSGVSNHLNLASQAIFLKNSVKKQNALKKNEQIENNEKDVLVSFYIDNVCILYKLQIFFTTSSSQT